VNNTYRTVEAVARVSYGRLVAYLASQTRDVAAAEDALSDAPLSALTIWSRDGVPRGRNLAQEAIWLARVLRELMPGEPEIRGLLALMLFCESRRPARRTPDGRYVPLSEQDPTTWSSAAIVEAESGLALAAEQGRIGRYQLEAAIQSVHAERARTGRTDWAPALEAGRHPRDAGHDPAVAPPADRPEVDVHAEAARSSRVMKEISTLTMRMATENSAWGYTRWATAFSSAIATASGPMTAAVSSKGPACGSC
jgi:predicted RNA polymerase sigma factor